MADINPKYSVIIPLFNKAPYVRKTLESVVNQTFTDYELIIVDDGSTDGSAAICKGILDSLTPSRIDSFKMIHQRNLGVAAARNYGVEESKGEYVTFLDADDLWKPTFLEEIDKLITDYPNGGIYATNYIYYKPGKTHVALNLPRGIMNYPQVYMESNSMPVTSITVCMPRRVFDEMKGFPVNIRLGEDFLLWAKTAIHYPVVFCEKPLAVYNNDIPSAMRATRNLHAPQYHMLFNLTQIEREIEQSVINNQQSVIWKQLLDKLRVAGLMEYWLSNEYHDVAALELAKIDWSKQSQCARMLYDKPIWYLKAKRRFMRIGSGIKQKMIKFYESSIFFRSTQSRRDGDADL